MKKATEKSIAQGAEIRRVLKEKGINQTWLAQQVWPHATKQDAKNRLQLVLNGRYFIWDVISKMTVNGIEIKITPS